MYFVGLGSATPPRRYAQVDCWMALQGSAQFSALAPRSRAILKKVLTGKNGITSRYLALEPLQEAFNISPDALHARFSQHAPALAANAAARALAEAGLAPEAMDAVIISTCTGYLCPGLTSYVSERLKLRPDVMALDLVGQGCGAALPNLRLAESLLQSGRCEHVLSVCVEVCSAAFYLDDDPGVLISACLFGDGAGAAVLSRKPGARRHVEWKACGSLLEPQDREILRFESKGGMLRNILSPLVPGVTGRHAKTVFDTVTAQAGVAPGEITGWIFHAGGREVLAALQQSLGLLPDDVRWSVEILDEHGNLSSPFVLFTLQRALRENAPGGLWWLSSFGAGFSCHGAILEVAPA
ncbi:MAG TPA: 3-oxoacyl-[acyl-carrier-protein] synthase III C-terminal domain-containing protein [Verrucomicrobiae bacterium]|nr:3-oxoacyl-[acyl-carrier-protein] synthase III C-terminal domain-containing protein [Verrucomicrobiae bacterium]